MVANSSKENLPVMAGTALAVLFAAAVGQRIFSKTCKHLYLKYLAKKRQKDDNDVPDAIVSEICIYPGKFL